MRFLTRREAEQEQLELTDGWSNSIESRLYVHARENPPLPGCRLRPDSSNFRMHEAILAAGHWPHLRIPALAHHSTPTTQACRGQGALTTEIYQ